MKELWHAELQKLTTTEAKIKRQLETAKRENASPADITKISKELLDVQREITKLIRRKQ